MDAFKSMLRPRGSITIPAYRCGDHEDNVDLQVKSLMYMFRRLRIAGDECGQDPVLDSLSAADRDHLDKMYNLPGFRRLLANDPHRVLVDWVKNRFRAMLLLSHHPQMEHMPRFNEPHFRFVVLEADASTDEYVRTLSRSDIYTEHPLPEDVRHDIAVAAVSRHSPSPESGVRSKDMRSAIILEYLHRVAVEIQVARIYKAMLGKMPKAHSSPQSSPPSSPGRVAHWRQETSPHQRSPSPEHRAEKSPQRGHRFPENVPRLSMPGQPFPQLRTSPASRFPQPQPQSPPSSPPRLRLKVSKSNLRLSEQAPNLREPRELTPVLDAGRKQLLQQARKAVQARVDRERQALNSATAIPV